MKRFIFPLLLLFTVVSTAQIKKSATFDFSKPLTLKPAVTPRDVSGGWEVITQNTFTDGQVQISFKQLTPSTYGAQLMSVQIPNTDMLRYYLDVTVGTSMVVTATDGAVLESIQLSDDSDNNGMTQCSSGGFENSSFRKWTPSNSNTTNVSINCTTNGTDIKKITVNYLLEADTYAPSSVSIEPGSTIEELSEISLTFPTPVIDGNTESIMATGGNSFSKEMGVLLDGNTATLTLENAVSTDGNYTIVIPAGRFKDSDGFYNKEIVYTYTVYAARNTFNPTLITPVTGETKSIPATITLLFDKNVKFEKKEFTLKKDGEAFSPVKAFVYDTNKKEVILSIEEGEVTDLGTYTIILPEKSIHNSFYGSESDDVKAYDRWNSDITLTYVVTGQDPNPGPGPDPQEDSEIMKYAKELLLMTGVGYPTESSTARQTLKNLVEADPVTADSELTTAIEAFYKSQEITLPETDKFYNIVGVNNGVKSVYLHYANGKVSITDDETKACAFKATANQDNTIVFSTPDGKYLHVLSSSDNYTSTSTNNVTANLSDINNLTLAKLNVDGVDDKLQFGLFTIYGSLGERKVVGTEDHVYALVDYNSTSVASDKDIQVMFATDYSSAFKFIETTDPGIFYVDLIPSVTRTENSQILKFSDDYTVELADGTQAGIIDSEQNKYPVTITKSSTEENTFIVTYTTLGDGEYSLSLPQGTFTATKEEKEYIVNESEVTITIVNDMSSFNETIGTFYVYNLGSMDNPIKDIDLNTFIIYVAKGQFSAFVADETKKVELWNTTAASYKVRTGVLKKYDFSEYTDALKLELDEPITEGSLPKGSYMYVILPGTIGDANFAKYLNGDTSVKKSDCNVNPIKRIGYTVDNDKATGITEHIINGAEPEVIYDLLGRRVCKISKSGLYIKNGKKILKK